jgi:hypothetical protein
LPKGKKPVPQMAHGKSLKLCKESRRVILNLEKGGEQVQSQQKIQNRCPASMADLRDIGKGRRAGPVSPWNTGWWHTSPKWTNSTQTQPVFLQPGYKTLTISTRHRASWAQPFWAPSHVHGAFYPFPLCFNKSSHTLKRSAIENWCAETHSSCWKSCFLTAVKFLDVRSTCYISVSLTINALGLYYISIDTHDGQSHRQRSLQCPPLSPSTQEQLLTSGLRDE